MASSLDFRIDVLINSLQEFQKEKENLEFRFKEAKTRRKALENKLDNVTDKCYQSKEKCMKMQETVNIAKQRVSQNQAQANRLKQLNEEKRSTITNLSKRLQEQEKIDDHEIRRFEDKLYEMAERFRTGKDYYQEHNILKETEEWNKQSVAAVAKVEDLKCALEEFRNKMQDLDSENENAKDKMIKTLKYGISPEELLKAQGLFIEMNIEASQSLVQVESELKKEEKMLKSLENELEKLTLSNKSSTDSQTQQVQETSNARLDIAEAEQGSRTSNNKDVLLEPRQRLSQTFFANNTIVADHTGLGISAPVSSVQHTFNNDVSQSSNTPLAMSNVSNKTQDVLRTSFRSRPFFISSPFNKG